jgi:hypothetical protein
VLMTRRAERMTDNSRVISVRPALCEVVTVVNDAE